MKRNWTGILHDVSPHTQKPSTVVTDWWEMPGIDLYGVFVSPPR